MLKRFLSRVLIVALFLSTSACTPKYHSKGYLGDGYLDVKKAKDQFVITYKGSAFSTFDKVVEYAYTRAAEVCLANEFDYFKIEKSRDLKEKDSKETSLKKKWLQVVIPTQYYSIELEIRCFKKDPKIFNVLNAKEWLRYHQAG